MRYALKSFFIYSFFDIVFFSMIDMILLRGLITNALWNRNIILV